MTAGTVARCGGGLEHRSHGQDCPAYWARCARCGWATEYGTDRLARQRLAEHLDLCDVDAWLDDMVAEFGVGAL